MSRSRDCAISTSKRFVPNGTTFWGVRRPFTCRVTFCFGLWRIGFRPIVSAISTLRASARSMERRRLRRPDSTQQPGEHLTELKAGTILGREWNGRMHRVSVLADGFAYEGKTYSSLSKVAFAITGTRWNGPRFFGLRDKSAGRSSAS